MTASYCTCSGCSYNANAPGELPTQILEANGFPSELLPAHEVAHCDGAITGPFSINLKRPIDAVIDGYNVHYDQHISGVVEHVLPSPPWSVSSHCPLSHLRSRYPPTNPTLSALTGPPPPTLSPLSPLPCSLLSPPLAAHISPLRVSTTATHSPSPDNIPWLGRSPCRFSYRC
ncbi:unnamed protein product [Closterium sp. Naga37s-1]|nr:unnamed protein product [Closterium sp. Naga37s-1]